MTRPTGSATGTNAPRDDTARQPVGEVDEDDLAEVRNELHFQDLGARRAAQHPRS